MIEAPRTVDVAMATFHREDRLLGLMPLLLAQGETAASALGIEFDYRVVVVDNDPDGSARANATATGDPRVHYVVEPNPGVGNARNRALIEAAETDILVFIDDDEMPHADWLVKLLSTHLEYKSDVVAGPVYPILEEELDPWVKASRIYDDPHRSHLRTGEPITRAATNNMLLDLRTVRRLGVTFDHQFGMTGGEDSVFTQQLADAGAIMVWCAEAAADYWVPADRSGRKYILERSYNLGNSGVRAEVHLAKRGSDRVLTQAKWAVTCAGSVAKGAAQALFGRATASLATQAEGEMRAMGGLGGLAGLVGATVTPYGTTDA